MNNLKFFCLTLNPEHENLIKRLSYTPVGLGTKKFSNECFSDKNEINISKKNPYYGEYTFHYWLWKNYLDKIQAPWVGFCQYRKFFSRKEVVTQNIDFDKLSSFLIKDIKAEDSEFDCILGKKFSVENYKISKIFKNHLSSFLINPILFFNKKKRSLKLHFDLFHGKGNLDLAISLLNKDDKNDFERFMYNQTAFNPHNMFICKKELLKSYYETLFPWLEKCESYFGFNDLKGYGLKRIYGFLAERFLSYWFTKNYKTKEIPILFKDLSDYK